VRVGRWELRSPGPPSGTTPAPRTHGRLGVARSSSVRNRKSPVPTAIQPRAPTPTRSTERDRAGAERPSSRCGAEHPPRSGLRSERRRRRQRLWSRDRHGARRRREVHRCFERSGPPPRPGQTAEANLGQAAVRGARRSQRPRRLLGMTRSVARDPLERPQRATPLAAPVRSRARRGGLRREFPPARHGRHLTMLPVGIRGAGMRCAPLTRQEPTTVQKPKGHLEPTSGQTPTGDQEPMIRRELTGDQGPGDREPTTGQELAGGREAAGGLGARSDRERPQGLPPSQQPRLRDWRSPSRRRSPQRSWVENLPGHQGLTAAPHGDPRARAVARAGRRCRPPADPSGRSPLRSLQGDRKANRSRDRDRRTPSQTRSALDSAAPVGHLSKERRASTPARVNRWSRTDVRHRLDPRSQAYRQRRMASPQADSSSGTGSAGPRPERARALRWAAPRSAVPTASSRTARRSGPGRTIRSPPHRRERQFAIRRAIASRPRPIRRRRGPRPSPWCVRSRMEGRWLPGPPSCPCATGPRPVGRFPRSGRVEIRLGPAWVRYRGTATPETDPPATFHRPVLIPGRRHARSARLRVNVPRCRPYPRCPPAATPASPNYPARVRPALPCSWFAAGTPMRRGAC
jgi:hypothetical protein